MRGKITSWFEGCFFIAPDGGEALMVFCHEKDLQAIPQITDLRVEFDLVPDHGMFRATNVRAAE